MLATKVPYFHHRNGIYYYRNQSVWKSLITHCKIEAFRKVSHTIFGTAPAIDEKSHSEAVPLSLLKVILTSVISLNTNKVTQHPKKLNNGFKLS